LVILVFVVIPISINNNSIAKEFIVSSFTKPNIFFKNSFISENLSLVFEFDKRQGKIINLIDDSTTSFRYYCDDNTINIKYNNDIIETFNFKKSGNAIVLSKNNKTDQKIYFNKDTQDIMLVFAYSQADPFVKKLDIDQYKIFANDSIVFNFDNEYIAADFIQNDAYSIIEYNNIEYYYIMQNLSHQSSNNDILGIYSSEDMKMILELSEDNKGYILIDELSTDFDFICYNDSIHCITGQGLEFTIKYSLVNDELLFSILPQVGKEIEQYTLIKVS